MVANVQAINTLLNSVKGSKLSKLSSWQSHGALTAFMSVCVALRCPGELTKDLTKQKYQYMLY